jgi:Zn-dependent protease with chaperone function
VLVLLAFAAAVIAMPHLLPLHVVRPVVAVSVWVAALALRALTALSVTLVLTIVTCGQTRVPLVGVELGLNDHALGRVVTPLLALALTIPVALELRTVVRSVRRMREVVCAEIATGPEGSVVVGGEPIAVAAAGLSRPRIVVSAGALTALDDAELELSLEHERGHIQRRHRFVLLLGELCAAAAISLPGSRAAFAELAFYIERDADEWALRRHPDRLALASAICKAAQGRRPDAAMTGLDGSHAVRRVSRLVDDPQWPWGRLTRPTGELLAAGLAAAMVLLAATLFTTAATDVARAHVGSAGPSGTSSPRRCGAEPARAHRRLRRQARVALTSDIATIPAA